RACGIGDEAQELGGAGEQAAVQDLLQRLREQVVVPLNPLEVRAVTGVFAGPPELEECDAIDVVLPGSEHEPRVRVVHFHRNAYVDAADVVNDLHEAEVAEFDEMIDPDAGDRKSTRLNSSH